MRLTNHTHSLSKVRLSEAIDLSPPLCLRGCAGVNTPFTKGTDVCKETVQTVP